MTTVWTLNFMDLTLYGPYTVWTLQCSVWALHSMSSVWTVGGHCVLTAGVNSHVVDSGQGIPPTGLHISLFFTLHSGDST